MPPSYSSYTASPTRNRSPPYSPTRRDTSEEGSQYEVDLDALGLNSTFDTSMNEDTHAPKIDVVDTSDIGGPEDFTMNMTYWMTADLPLSNIRSRKEANARISEPRSDMRQDTDMQENTAEGDRVVLEDTARDRIVSENTMRAEEPQEAHHERDRTQASMENDEKVMSYLSALPDTEMPGALTSTPLKVAPQPELLRVPSPAVSRPRSVRSLQPTVEDYDTPRKPTQETVIHHPLPNIPTREEQELAEDANYRALQDHMVDLQTRLEQQELTSRTRIAELETILTYTRTEFDKACRENILHKEEIPRLKSEGEQHERDQQSREAEVAERLQEKDRELSVRMQEYREEVLLQNLSKLQSQREDFEKKLGDTAEAGKAADEQMKSKDELIQQLQQELDEMRQSNDQESGGQKDPQAVEQQKRDDESAKEHDHLTQELSAIQTRAESLQAALEQATADAKSAREEARVAREEVHTAQPSQAVSQASSETLTDRISELETYNISLKSQLDSVSEELKSKDQQLLRNIKEQDRLDQQLSTAEGRNVGLEATISALRKQLADAHRESAKARTDVERLEKDMEAWEERLEDARKEADRRVADVEIKLSKMKELKADAESRLKHLQSTHDDLIEEHDTQLDGVREKAEDAVRKVGGMLETERSEKRRLAKELKKCNDKLDKLRAELARRAEEDIESEEDETSMISAQSDSKDAEIENLRILVKNQASTVKSYKSELSTLRKKLQFSTIHQTSEMEDLRSENASLKSTIASQRAEFEELNKMMDERLAASLSKFLKERSKAIQNKRDDQWLENVANLKGEKEFMGKVLMREWGRQECGPAKEEEKENQTFRYKFVDRKDRSVVGKKKGQSA